ncbi:MAG: pseudouridine synthase [Nitrospirota bacterium]|nr:pseudouridine synthase [Nitrospirota bacterium]
MQVRLQKVIAASGLASRRKAEDLIRQGRVTVNGAVTYKLGTCVDPQVDHVKVNGDHVGSAEPEVFILLHKPAGYLTTMKDPQGRPTVANLVEKVRLRVVPVGRLDFDAEGLLLLTNNGKIAQACLHPKYHVPKTYLVKVSKVLSEEELALLRQGIQLDDGMTFPAVVKKSGKARVNSWIEMTIFEGRSHQVKRMLEALGHRVLRLKRIRFGPLGLGDLLPGDLRFATDAEANALRAILERIPRREKLPLKIVRAPEAPIQRIRPQVRQRSAQTGPSERRGVIAQKSSRKPTIKVTNNFQKKKPALAARSTKDTQLRAKPSPGIKGPRRPVERSKNKRPSFPHGVKPQVVLQAFMDHEKQVLDELKERSSRYLKNTPPVHGRKADTKSGSPSRAKPAQSSRSRNSSKPRPATPKGQSRSTTRPRAPKSRVLKRSRG